MKLIIYPILNIVLGAWIVLIKQIAPTIRFASIVAAVIIVINIVQLFMNLKKGEPRAQGEVSLRM